MNRISVFGSAVSFVVCGVLLFGVNGVAGAAQKPPSLTPVVSFDPTLGELPESITADDDGHVYASLVNGQIREITPGHGMSTVATIPLPSGGLLTGIKVGPDGLIYVTSCSFTADPDAAFVWRVDPETGEVELFASLDAQGFPNDMAFDDDGTLYVTDPFLGLVWQIDPNGTPRVFLSDPLFQGNPAAPVFVIHEFGVDGIAFDHNKRNLYVTNVDYGRVMRIPFGCGAPSPHVVVESAALEGVDGIALDRQDTLYAAVNTQNRLATVDDRGHISVLFDGAPLDSPSSLVFGTGHSDKKTLYVSNFAINSVNAGLPAHPGINSLPVQVPGLTLP